MSERMNKERAKQKIINHKEYCEKVLDSAVKRYTQLVGDYDNVEKIAELIQALDIAIKCMQDEEVEWKDSMTVEELEKMAKKALEDYSEEEIKKAVSKFSKTIKQLNNRIQGKDNEWVDVRDRLPSDDKFYLVTANNELYIASYDNKTNNWWSETYDFSSLDVIAWKIIEPYERKE